MAFFTPTNYTFTEFCQNHPPESKDDSNSEAKHAGSSDIFSSQGGKFELMSMIIVSWPSFVSQQES